MNKRILIKKGIKQIAKLNKTEYALLATVCVLGGYVANKISSLKKDATLASVVKSGLKTSDAGEENDK